MRGDSQLKVVKSRAEVFFAGSQSLSASGRDAVIACLLEDPQLGEDILDLAVIKQQQAEPSKPFTEYLAERKERARKA